MTHTPAPWLWQTNRYHCFEIVASDRPLTIATLGGTKEDLVNAHLIAAAPELLEALESIAYSETFEPIKWLEIAREAVNKVKGQGAIMTRKKIVVLGGRDD